MTDVNKFIELLEQYVAPDRQLTVESDHALLRCPLPNHAGGNENTPSFRIWFNSAQPGRFYCFGCGAHGTWRDTCSALGLPSGARFLAEEVVTDAFSDDEAAAVLGRKPKLQVSRHNEYEEPWPTDAAWRSVPGWLVAGVGGKMIVAGDGRDPLLRLPVFVRRKRVGHVDCRVFAKDDGKNYLNLYGEWAKSALFPYDFVRSLEPDIVAIVEGSRDALISIACGLPALATLGSTSWNATCVALVKSLNPALVLIMADPDDAGDRLKAKVWHDLEGEVPLKPIALPSKIVYDAGKAKKKKLVDPADLRPKTMERVLRIAGVEYDLRAGRSAVRRACSQSRVPT